MNSIQEFRSTNVMFFDEFFNTYYPKTSYLLGKKKLHQFKNVMFVLKNNKQIFVNGRKSHIMLSPPHYVFVIDKDDYDKGYVFPGEVVKYVIVD